jgi:hypothetical protein
MMNDDGTKQTSNEGGSDDNNTSEQDKNKTNKQLSGRSRRKTKKTTRKRMTATTTRKMRRQQRTTKSMTGMAGPGPGPGPRKWDPPGHVDTTYSSSNGLHEHPLPLLRGTARRVGMGREDEEDYRVTTWETIRAVRMTRNGGRQPKMLNDPAPLPAQQTANNPGPPLDPFKWQKLPCHPQVLALTTG